MSEEEERRLQEEMPQEEIISEFSEDPITFASRVPQETFDLNRGDMPGARKVIAMLGADFQRENILLKNDLENIRKLLENEKIRNAALETENRHQKESLNYLEKKGITRSVVQSTLGTLAGVLATIAYSSGIPYTTRIILTIIATICVVLIILLNKY